jgi:hypothetical protein
VNSIKSNLARRAAGVYQHSEVLILHAFQQLGGGPDMATIPVARLSLLTPVDEIGGILRNMLLAYQITTRPLSNWQAMQTQFLQATGFRSWRALEKSAKMCWIEEIDDRIIFTPLRNGGTKGPQKGFQPFGAAEITVARNISNEELGQTLLTALSQSQ